MYSYFRCRKDVSYFPAAWLTGMLGFGERERERESSASVLDILRRPAYRLNLVGMLNVLAGVELGCKGTCSPRREHRILLQPCRTVSSMSFCAVIVRCRHPAVKKQSGTELKMLRNTIQTPLPCWWSIPHRWWEYLNNFVRSTVRTRRQNAHIAHSKFQRKEWTS